MRLCLTFLNSDADCLIDVGKRRGYGFYLCQIESSPDRRREGEDGGHLYIRLVQEEEEGKKGLEA